MLQSVQKINRSCVFAHSKLDILNLMLLEIEAIIVVLCNFCQQQSCLVHRDLTTLLSVVPSNFQPQTRYHRKFVIYCKNGPVSGTILLNFKHDYSQFLKIRNKFETSWRQGCSWQKFPGDYFFEVKWLASSWNRNVSMKNSSTGDMSKFIRYYMSNCIENGSVIISLTYWKFCSI